MAPGMMQEEHFNSRGTSFLLCITYAHIDCCFFPPSPSETSHPYQSLGVSSPHTGSLPFPPCLLRNSQTAFKKDFHKRPLLQILPPRSLAGRHLYLNSKGY